MHKRERKRVKKAAVSTTIATSFLITHDVDIVIRQFSRHFFSHKNQGLLSSFLSLLSLNLFTYTVRYTYVCMHVNVCSTILETYKAPDIMSVQTLKCLNKTYYVFADN